jgi:hypothetical protein
MISILLPTRHRPDGLRRVIDTALHTSVISHNLEFVAYVDNDDTSYDKDFPELVIRRGPRIVLSNMWNKCAELAKGDIFMQGNDDILFKTHGWDIKVEFAFEQSKSKILMVHGSDGSGSGHRSARGEFGPHPFLHRRWFETLGYVTPPYFSSDYGDTWINDLANALDCRSYIPFVIEHCHFHFGKASQDDVTMDRLMRHSSDGVDRIYEELEPLRNIDIDKLRAAALEPYEVGNPDSHDAGTGSVPVSPASGSKTSA